MPIVRVEMLPGRTDEQKAALVKAMTDAMVNIAKTPSADGVHVIITETAGEHWATGGEMLSVKMKAAAK
ncbi:MAG: 2-hydroxymuconate tautomerase [Dehalococcoidia bacterium]